MDDTGTRYTPIRIRPNSMSTQMQTKVISQPNALGGYGILYAAAVMHRGGGQRRHFEIQKFVTNGPFPSSRGSTPAAAYVSPHQGCTFVDKQDYGRYKEERDEVQAGGEQDLQQQGAPNRVVGFLETHPRRQSTTVSARTRHMHS